MPVSATPMKQELNTGTTARLAKLVAGRQPGSRLPTEKQLCAQLGVSRSTLREAMRSLAFVGALEPRQGSGTYVGSMEGGAVEKLIGLALMMERCSVQEVIEARRVLEVEAVRLAARRHDEADRRGLTAGMDKMKAALEDPESASSHDLDFHILLAQASHNTVLINFLNGMRGLLNIWISRAVTRPPVVMEILSEHNAILSAVLQRDSEEAAARMYIHLTNAADRLLRVIGQDQTIDYISLLIEKE
jgi:GntR family transcriptional regulator, transcriptional repressor for pyruvate dehydrogenase complex